MIQLVQNKGLDLYELVLDLGISPGNYPYTPSDCFSYQGVGEKEERIFREHKVASLITLLKEVIPHDKPISGKYSNAGELVNRVKTNSKYSSRAAVKYAPAIVESGIDKLIGFYLVRELDEVKDFPPLTEMRGVILAAKTHQQITIRGAHKGPYAQEAFNSSIAILRSFRVRMFTNEFCILMQEYLLKKRYLENDKDADFLLEQLAKDNQKLLPAVLPASGDRK